MPDKIIRATAEGEQIRMFVADTTQLVSIAAQNHQLTPVAAAALGRTLTAAAIMGRMLKGKNDTISIQIKGDGPLGGILAISDSQSNVRGYVHHPTVDLLIREDGKLDVGRAVGKGTLTVIKDLGMREPYSGQIPLISGEIGVDLTYYFASSEQTPSVVAVGVLVNPDGTVACAGGYIIQLLPESDEKITSYIENTVDSLPPVTTLLTSGETPEGIADLFFGDRDLHILEVLDCQYKCNCSRERMERGLISLGRQELEQILAEEEETVCHCHFCNRDYAFSKKDIRQLIDAL